MMQQPTGSLLADQAYDALKRDILLCILEPGSQLVQGELVARYSLGITPIREALKRLEMEGYVKTYPRFGTIITPVTIEDINDIYEMRLILEKSAVRLAGERATPQQLDDLTRFANFTYKFGDVNSYLLFLNHNREFHSMVAAASGNQRLQDAISVLLESMIRIFHLGLDLRDSGDEMRVEHVNLVEAMRSGDVDRMESVMEEQIMNSRERVVEMLNKQTRIRSEITFPPDRGGHL